jgi:hypothetical protein
MSMQRLVKMMRLAADGPEEAREKGIEEGARMMVRALLAKRGFTLDEEQTEMLGNCGEIDTLERWLLQAVDAETIQQALRVVREYPPRLLDEDGFWRVLRGARPELYYDNYVLALPIRTLSAMSFTDLEHFDTLLGEKLFALDTCAHARAVYAGQFDPFERPCLFDYDFLYARCAVVLKGRAAYEEALGDPSRMPTEDRFDGLLDLVSLAHQRKTGKSLARAHGGLYYPFANAAGWVGSVAEKDHVTGRTDEPIREELGAH